MATWVLVATYLVAIVSANLITAADAQARQRNRRAIQRVFGAASA